MNELQKIENFVIFQTDSGKINVEVYFQNGTLWLTQKAMATLFEKDRSVITKHMDKLFNSGELNEEVKKQLKGKE